MAKQTVRATERRLEPSFAERFIEPFTRMRTGVDHLMDELPARWSAFQFPASPVIEMAETDTLYTIDAEIPGVANGDVEIQVDRDTLIIKGEKKEKSREEHCDYVISERAYGSFERRISLPHDALIDEITAEQEAGMLRIAIPRSKDARSEKRKIEIHSKSAS